MKKNKAIFITAVIFLFVALMVSYGKAIAADCGEKCNRKCDGLGSGPKWAKCMEKCMKDCRENDPINVPQPVPDKPTNPRSDLYNSKSNAYSNAEKDKSGSTIVLASAFDDNDQPCYVGGKHVGNCSRNNPYYNVLNGDCHATLKDCIAADPNVEGQGGCVRCHKLELPEARSEGIMIETSLL